MITSPYGTLKKHSDSVLTMLIMLQAHMACLCYRHQQDTSCMMTLTRSMSLSTPGAGWQGLITNGKASTSVISM